MKKSLLWVVVLLLSISMIAMFSLAGCKEEAAEEEVAEEEVAEATAAETTVAEETTTSETILVRFWNGFTASDGDILREIVDRFNEENELGIVVEMNIMPWGNMLEKLAPALSTGTAPALILLGMETIPEYAASGGLIPLDEFWAWSGLDKGNYLQNVQDSFVFENVTYGIPMQYNTFYLYWNKDLFIEEGLDPEQPPKTFDELKEYAEKLTDLSKQQYGYGIQNGNRSITDFLWSNGGDWLNSDQTEAASNSPEMIEVLTMLQGFANEGLTPVGMSGADLDNLLYAGQLGMYVNGPWLINGCKQAGLNFGIDAIPASNSGNLQVPGSGVGFMVSGSATEEEKIAAFEFIKYWLSKDILKEWTLRNGFPAWSNEVLADEEVQNDPLQKVLGPLTQYGRVPFLGMPEYGKIAADYLDPLFEKLMYDEITPEECAKQMTEGINTILGN